MEIIYGTVGVWEVFVGGTFLISCVVWIYNYSKVILAPSFSIVSLTFFAS